MSRLDDGMQFTGTSLPHKAITETTYSVFVRYSVGGGSNLKYRGTDKVVADTEMAKLDTMNVGRIARGVAAYETWTTVEEPEVQEVIAELVAEEVVEISISESVVESVEVAESGKFEVHVDGIGTASFIAYRGDSLKEAQATVTRYIGKCSRVQTRFEGSWVYTSGLFWDFSEEYRANQRAGVFDNAYMRDWLNGEFEAGRTTDKQCDEQYQQFSERRASHVGK